MTTAYCRWPLFCVLAAVLLLSGVSGDNTSALSNCGSNSVTDPVTQLSYYCPNNPSSNDNISGQRNGNVWTCTCTDNSPCTQCTLSGGTQNTANNNNANTNTQSSKSTSNAGAIPAQPAWVLVSLVAATFAAALFV